MFPFVKNPVSREMLPGDKRGGIFHDADPPLRTMQSRYWSILNAVADLKLDPIIREALQNRSRTVNNPIANVPLSEAAQPQVVAKAEDSSSNIIQVPGQAKHPLSEEEASRLAYSLATATGARASMLPTDVANSLSVDVTQLNNYRDLSRGA